VQRFNGLNESTARIEETSGRGEASSAKISEAQASNAALTAQTRQILDQQSPIPSEEIKNEVDYDAPKSPPKKSRKKAEKSIQEIQTKVGKRHTKTKKGVEEKREQQRLNEEQKILAGYEASEKVPLEGTINASTDIGELHDEAKEESQKKTTIRERLARTSAENQQQREQGDKTKNERTAKK